MKTLLFILSLFAIGLGFLFFTNAKSAIHEIEGLLSIMIGVQLFVGAAIMGAIQRNRSKDITPEKS